jgi:hypothetical protein
LLTSVAGCLARTLLPLMLLLATADAHPASGIVVDDHGTIFFIDSRHALYRINTQGVTAVVKTVSDGHWLAIDRLGSFANSNPRYFERVTPPGAIPVLIYAGGGAPITIGHDGALYYGSGESNGDPMFPGGLELSRMEPDGRQSKVSDELKRTLASWDDGITALATGPRDSVYVGTWTGLLKVNFRGAAEVIQHPLIIPGCDVDFADHKQGNKLPLVRGLAVLPDGTVFAAATSCHAVVRISPSGTIQTVLKAERPWSPTGLALNGHDLYVLEYTSANGPGTEGWRPRIRRVDVAGHVVTIATFK